MQSWKHAFWLTKYELKHSKINFLLLLGVTIILLLLITPIISDYLLKEEHSFNLDIFFLVAFLSVPIWVRPKIFQIQKVSGFLWATHFVITLNQLPIKKDVIVRYRFLTYSIISLLFGVIFLTALYILSPTLPELMPVSTYFIFSLCWISFSIGLGSSQLISEAGANLVVNIILSILIFAPIAIIIIVILFYKNYQFGLVNWTMFIANNFPIWTVGISVLLALIGSLFWMRQMHRKMNKVDYLA